MISKEEHAIHVRSVRKSCTLEGNIFLVRKKENYKNVVTAQDN